MKGNEVKAQFIELRAEGLSYDKITGQLHISKATCTKWQAELSKQISTREQEHLAELYKLYGMSKAARIKKLGKILQQIDEALEVWGGCMDLTPEQLLTFKLKYEKALKDEASEIQPISISDYSSEGILTLKADIYQRLKAGVITDRQALAEMSILNDIQPIANTLTLTG